MGVFAAWQPAYAEAGVATFPVVVDAERKKPAVGNYLTAGKRASEQWAFKFPDADALGFTCGPRNRLAVVDIDKAGENLVADAMAIFGPTPAVVRTASGKHHLYYRHSGERRKIRASGVPFPVDILGGGMAVAPPSKAAGGSYEWAQGSLADLASLPAMLRAETLPETFPNASEILGAANDGNALARIAEGERNTRMFQWALQQARTCGTQSELAERVAAFNVSGLASPLSSAEALGVAARAWGYEERGENWAGTGQRVTLSHVELDRLLPLGPDAVALLIYLRRTHWGRDFAVANAMADHMPDGVWNLKRFASARQTLVRAGEIVEVRPPSRRLGPAVYRFGRQS